MKRPRRFHIAYRASVCSPSTSGFCDSPLALGMGPTERLFLRNDGSASVVFFASFRALPGLMPTHSSMGQPTPPEGPEPCERGSEIREIPEQCITENYRRSKGTGKSRNRMSALERCALEARLWHRAPSGAANARRAGIRCRSRSVRTPKAWCPGMEALCGV